MKEKKKIGAGVEDMGGELQYGNQPRQQDGSLDNQPTDQLRFPAKVGCILKNAYRLQLALDVEIVDPIGYRKNEEN